MTKLEILVIKILYSSGIMSKITFVYDERAMTYRSYIGNVW